MNETPPPPTPELDDPALLAEIEAEFADLTREIERISAMPASMQVEKNQLLQALRESWRNRLAAHQAADRPEWRRRLDETLNRAVDRLLEDGLHQNADGSLAFNLRGQTLQEEGGPVIRGLLDGFVHMLEEKFPPPDKAQAAAPDAPPANPMQAILGGLGQALAGALKNAIQQQTVGPKATIKSGTQADGATTVQVLGEEKLSASFEFDTRKTADADKGVAEGEKAQPAAGPNPVGAAFFQQLFQGFGQAVKQAITPKADSAPTPSAPHAEDGATPHTPPDEAPAASQPKPASEPPNPLSGLGQLLAQALQKVAAAGPLVAKSTQPAPAPGPPPAPPPAATGAEPNPTPPEGSTDTPPPSAESAKHTTPAQDTPDPSPKHAKDGKDTAPEPKPATLQIDLAGLLQQLLGGKTPPKS